MNNSNNYYPEDFNYNNAKSMGTEQSTKSTASNLFSSLGNNELLSMLLTNNSGNDLMKMLLNKKPPDMMNLLSSLTKNTKTEESILKKVNNQHFIEEE